MAQPFASRRAAAYRQRARELAEVAAHEWRDEGRRRHLVELAAQYQRTADALAPPSPRELLIEHLKSRAPNVVSRSST
jgi:hypothetical protein